MAGDSVSRQGARAAHDGLVIEQTFSTPGKHPFDEVDWLKRSAKIADGSRKAVFHKDEVEFPASWSQLAANVVASKYCYGEAGKPERERSLKQLIHRVCRTIADWGIRGGYFNREDGETFYRELTWLCVNQYGAFNSPVWFNFGLYHQYGVGKHSARGNWRYDPKTKTIGRAATQYEAPQGSACFIQSVEDNMESIMKLAHSEAMLFKYGYYWDAIPDHQKESPS